MDVSTLHPAIVPVPARRHPHQVLVAALLMVSGLPILLGGARPGSLNQSLPTPLLYLWAAVAVAGGAMVVTAAIVGPISALYLELIADVPLSIVCFAYSISAVMVGGPRAIVAAAIVTAAALAFLVRARQVYRTFVRLRRRE